MRRMMLCAVAMLVLGACHGGGGARTTTFVNEKSPAETLKLEYQPSVYNHVTSLWGDLKLQGGVYTRTTAAGATSGKYTYSVRGKKRAYVFQPAEGETWGVEVAADGSFTDERGVWKRAASKVDVKAPELAKVGN